MDELIIRCPVAFCMCTPCIHLVNLHSLTEPKNNNNLGVIFYINGEDTFIYEPPENNPRLKNRGAK